MWRFKACSNEFLRVELLTLTHIEREREACMMIFFYNFHGRLQFILRYKVYRLSKF